MSHRNAVPKAELYPLVEALIAHGCNSEEVAAYLWISGQRVRQILRDMGMHKRTHRTLDDLPHDLRQRVIAHRIACECATMSPAG